MAGRAQGASHRSARAAGVRHDARDSVSQRQSGNDVPRAGVLRVVSPYRYQLRLRSASRMAAAIAVAKSARTLGIEGAGTHVPHAGARGRLSASRDRPTAPRSGDGHCVHFASDPGDSQQQLRCAGSGGVGPRNAAAVESRAGSFDAVPGRASGTQGVRLELSRACGRSGENRARYLRALRDRIPPRVRIRHSPLAGGESGGQIRAAHLQARRLWAHAARRTGRLRALHGSVSRGHVSARARSGMRKTAYGLRRGQGGQMNARVDDGGALPQWSDYMQSLAGAGDLVQLLDAPADARGGQEVFPLLFLSLGTGFMSAFADPDHPDFVAAVNTVFNASSTNPDFLYLQASVDAAGVYRISGVRGTALFVHGDISAGGLGVMDELGPSVGQVDLDALNLKDDGSF